MVENEKTQLTSFIKASRKGNKEAKDKLFTLVYKDLKRIARKRWAGKFGDTMQPTAVVHEAYIFFEKKFQLPESHEIENREIFFRTIGYAMRAILKDYWRKKRSEKRGGRKDAVPADSKLSDKEPDSDFEKVDFFVLDQAINRLEELNPRWFNIVMHKYFAGRTNGETAELMGISKTTVVDDWTLARAWLKKQF